ncbi:hypothetical protein E2N92_06940 [Methanofollis formosanus]|uniref:Uncharacterized protein n=1 Tax=Methanofollis formosanus TaxID=299308 RepID=A0A8G1A2E4_9EURY|nr:hypothetical protein [Methanofollis formosanus]QYZ79188.1 hypothetical protein E2N92_06940 [Methanofollis formosanus]
MQTDRPYVYELRDLDNPMTEAEIMDLQENLTANLSRHIGPGTGNQPIFASAYPMIPENGTIVAYGFSIDEEGTTHQMMGVVDDESDIEAVHEKAGQWLEEIRNEPDPLSFPDVPDGWITLSEGDYYYEARPYGAVENNFELYYHTVEADPDHEWYAVQQTFSMDPGFHRWREDSWSKWAGESGRCWNNWSYAAPTLHPSLHDHEPLGTRVGLENLLSVYIEDNSDPVTRTARWDLSITSPEAKKTEQRWNFRSSMVTHISDAAGEYCLRSSQNSPDHDSTCERDQSEE